MKGNIIKEKSFEFAVRIVNLYKHLVEIKKREFDDVINDFQRIMLLIA